MSHTTIKEKVTKVKGTQKIFYEINLHSLSQESSSFTDLSIGGGFAGFPSTKTTIFTASSIYYDEELSF